MFVWVVLLLLSDNATRMSFWKERLWGWWANHNREESSVFVKKIRILESLSCSSSSFSLCLSLSSRTAVYFGVTKRAANHLTQCLDSHPHTTDPHYQTVNHCQRSKSLDSSQAPIPQSTSFHTWYQIALWLQQHGNWVV